MDWTAIHSFFQNLFERFKPDIVGVIGTIIAAWYGRSEIAGKMDFFVYVISGIANVHLFTAPAMHYLSISQNQAPTVGFVIGLFGGSVCAMIRRGLSNADLWSLIKSKFGGGQS